MRTGVNKHVGGWCVCGVLVLATALAAMPQTSPQAPPVFRAGTRVVPVDVRVVDKKGQPVTDLTQADFTILEDGVPQDVRHFFAQGLTAQTPPPNARVLRQAQPSAAMAPQDHRVFLIVFGRGNLTGPADGVQGVLHLVRDRLLPQDRVAVFAWNRATDFTTDHAKIVQVLERLKRTQLGIDLVLAQWEGSPARLYGNREVPADIQRQIDAAFGAAADGVRTMHPAINQQTQAVQDGLANARLVADARLGHLGMSFDEFAELASSKINDLGNLYTAIEYLGQIDGEKHLVWLQHTGVYLPRVEDDRSLARAASDARVALSIIRAGGTIFTGAGLGEARALPRSNARIAEGELAKSVTSRTVAEVSGGRYDANRFKDASQAADYIEQASRFGYLLGYTPANAKSDGRFRNIKVTVKRPGLTVLYRHGYFAREAFVPFDRAGALSFSRIASAAEYPREIPDIGLKATASMAGSGTAREVRVDITIDLTRVQFESAGGRQTATIEVGVFCLDGRQRPVGDLMRKIELNYTEDRFRQAREEGVVVALTVPVTATPESLKLVAYDYGADLIGSKNVKVKK